ncbi:MAG TPA: GNAT family N-acetyltransferase [Actinospica sp.]|nr:GNAT family N-acetyltransferase [Actinospica sp.]
MDLTWRRLTPSDAAEMAAVCDAAAAADRIVGSGPRTVRELADSFDVAGRAAPPVHLGAFADDRLAGFGAFAVSTAADPVHRMPFAGRVHPDFRRRGIGTELLRRAVAGAPALHALAFPDAPLELSMLTIDDVPGQTALAAAAGFTPWRVNLKMSRELARQDADALRVPTPEGLELVGFASEYVEPLRAAHNTALVPDHPGSTPTTAQLWASRFTRDDFRADLSFLALDRPSGTVAGYLLANEHTPDPGTQARDAHLSTIATLRAYRGRGVASALIGAALAEAARQGYRTASLDVHADNPSGAVRVYQRAGFRTARRATAHLRKIAV